jgi:CRP-like cAMP-binding protein
MPSTNGADHVQQSLDTAAARNLATTTKTIPQMQGISARWLIRMLPWVHVSGGTYRVNQRRSYVRPGPSGGQVSFADTADGVRIVPATLGAVPLLAGFDDGQVLEALANGFARQEVEAGATIVDEGQAADRLFVVVHGKVNRIGPGRYEQRTQLAVEADGDFFGEEAFGRATDHWAFSAVAATRCTLLSLTRRRFRTIVGRWETLQAHLRDYDETAARPRNRKGEADIAIASGHDGEPAVAGTFADYEAAPRKYQLSVAQTMLRVHSRVADLFDDPMDQHEQQLRLTVEALRERQEHDMVNNPGFGLLHNVDRHQRIQTRSGPPTPDDLDDLLCRRRSTRLFLAHPRAIAAFGRECNRRGIYPKTVEVQGTVVPAWRNVPMLPCNKIPISAQQTSTILAMRTGEDDQGVVGLHQAGIPEEHEPSLNVRLVGTGEQAIHRYLVSAYYSVAVLVPDALGALENVEIAHPDS